MKGRCLDGLLRFAPSDDVPSQTAPDEKEQGVGVFQEELRTWIPVAIVLPAAEKHGGCAKKCHREERDGGGKKAFCTTSERSLGAFPSQQR